MHTLLSALALTVMTLTLAPVVYVASLLRIPERPGSIYERCMRLWARSLCGAAGVTIRVHGEEHVQRGRGTVYVANHVSWFDVFVLASILPRYTFVAKAELRRIPIFGRGAEAAGVVFIERENRKAAFESYRRAAEDVQRGRAVVVCPEGTRGDEYALRPFKKGPFVLAIAAGAPIVPTIVYGAREVMGRRSLLVRPHVVDVHFMAPVETAGMAYDARDAIVSEVWTRMAAEMERLYGVRTAARPISTGRVRPA
jgi:1-acyl-sn-glycerol-3-phosphate acyltransferase